MLRTVDASYDAGERKPFNRIFKFGSSCARFDQLILEPGILLGKLHSNIVVDEPCFLDFILRVIFAHIVKVACQDHILRMAHFGVKINDFDLIYLTILHE